MDSVKQTVARVSAVLATVLLMSVPAQASNNSNTALLEIQNIEMDCQNTSTAGADLAHKRLAESATSEECQELVLPDATTSTLIKLAPSNASWRYYRAKSLAELGDFGSADEQLEQCIGLAKNGTAIQKKTQAMQDRITVRFCTSIN